jgi:hypothetical protein
LRPVTTVIDVRRGDFRVVQTLLDTFLPGLRESAEGLDSDVDVAVTIVPAVIVTVLGVWPLAVVLPLPFAPAAFTRGGLAPLLLILEGVHAWWRADRC